MLNKRQMLSFCQTNIFADVIKIDILAISSINNIKQKNIYARMASQNDKTGKRFSDTNIKEQIRVKKSF